MQTKKKQLSRPNLNNRTMPFRQTLRFLKVEVMALRLQNPTVSLPFLLMVELSGDGTYWNINTAGIFKPSYGRNRKEVYNRHIRLSSLPKLLKHRKVQSKAALQHPPA
jgi:hypothetical protein